MIFLIVYQLEIRRKVSGLNMELSNYPIWLLEKQRSDITLTHSPPAFFWVFHQFSKVDREFNSMNIQRRNVSSERIRILFSNTGTTDLFSVAVSKDFPQSILCHQI
jgi:hypothetical protein